MRGWAIITFIQPRQVISDEAEGRVGYHLARLDKSDNSSSPNLLTVLSANKNVGWKKISDKKISISNFGRNCWKRKILDEKNFGQKNFGQQMFGQKKIWSKKIFGQKKILVKKIFGLRNFLERCYWKVIIAPEGRLSHLIDRASGG